MERNKLQHAISQSSFLTLIILTVFLYSCESQHEKTGPLTIAISKGEPYEGYQKYHEYLRRADSTIIIIDMYGLGFDSAMSIIKNCDALLLTGGPDVEPQRYGELIDTLICGVPDLKRDSIELGLIDQALKLKMPILGICRGEQILNVYFGGSLYFDLPADFDTIVKHRLPGYTITEHHMNVVENSRFFKLVNLNRGDVNSNHHQAVKKLGAGLKAVAFSDDKLIEAIEFSDESPESFLLGIQWHPEHMNFENPLSGNIAKQFILEARAFQQHSLSKK